MTSTKGADMTFVLKIHFADESTEITEVDAETIAEAHEIARRDPEVVFVETLQMIDRAPQSCLAF